MNANYESLAAKHGDAEARRIMEEIRDLGGYGAIPIEAVGGLDLFSVLDPSNTAIDEKTKERIATLAGVSRKEVDRKIESGETYAGEAFKIEPVTAGTKAV